MFQRKFKLFLGFLIIAKYKWDGEGDQTFERDASLMDNETIIW